MAGVEVGHEGRDVLGGGQLPVSHVPGEDEPWRRQTNTSEAPSNTWQQTGRGRTSVRTSRRYGNLPQVVSVEGEVEGQSDSLDDKRETEPETGQSIQTVGLFSRPGR